MWQAGNCSGNECAFADCRGDPKVELTPIQCIDRSIEEEFKSWINTYSGTPDQLRECIFAITGGVHADSQSSDGTSSFAPSWCQSRGMFLDFAKTINEAIVAMLIVESVLIGAVLLLFGAAFWTERNHNRRKAPLSLIRLNKSSPEQTTHDADAIAV